MSKVLLVSVAAAALLVGGTSAPAAVPGANGRIAFQHSNPGGVGFVNRDGVGFVTLPAASFFTGEPAYAPDGRQVAYARGSNAGTDIHVVATDGSGDRAVTQTPGEDRDPAWSPDGGRLVFESYRFAAQSEIFTIAVDGTAERRLTENTVFDGDPAWSPDGARIAFTSQRDGNKEIYVMGADGSNPVRLTTNAESVSVAATQFVDENPQWSPDGRRIVFDSTRDGNFEVYVMNADGSDQRRLTDHPAIDANPAFSPDGKLIAFDSDRVQRGDRDLFTMNADGSSPTRLLARPGDDLAPDWSVAVVEQRGCTILGTIGDDTIVGGPGADKICALGGDDAISGGGGSDYVLGDAGDDELHGGTGRDQLFGGAGDDRIYGEGDRDFIYGEAGADFLSGGADVDRLQGHAGVDSYLGGSGNDSFYARDGRRETVDGGAGRDRASADRADRLVSVEKRF